MNLWQKVDEAVIDLIKRIRKMAGKHSVAFPESQLTPMAIFGMHPQSKGKLVGQSCKDLSGLASREVQIEQFVQEKERKRDTRGRGPQLVSMVNVAEDSNYDESADYAADILVAEIVKGKAFLCPAFKLAKGKEKNEEKVEYSFDISKSHQIFDYLLKDKQIELLDVQNLPPPEEVKENKYYKWHISFNHATSNCIIFHRAIHEALQKGRFKMSDKGASEMIFDTDPFPRMNVNMVFFLGSSQGKGKKRYVGVPKREIFPEIDFRVRLLRLTSQEIHSCRTNDPITRKITDRGAESASNTPEETS